MKLSPVMGQHRQTNTEPEAVATGYCFGSASLGTQNDPVATASGSAFFDPLWRSMLVALLGDD